MVFKVKDQIKTVYKGYSHVVILGAGASIAATSRDSEINSCLLPSMDNLIDIINIKEPLKEIISKTKSNNIEKIYSYLYLNAPNSDLIKFIEKEIYNYFDNLLLPDKPTIYDYLVLSLRNKDVIATFNWDPFLWQAYERNLELTNNLPMILHLHGNVAVGICENEKTFGPKGRTCLQCNNFFEPVPILYPVEKKDYYSNKFISDQWNVLKNALNKSVRVSIFGYSAPKSDLEAITLMKDVFTNSKIRPFSEFEIIDIVDELYLEEKWKDFTFSHHYKIHKSYFDSSINMFPRRSGEVFQHNILDAEFYEKNEPSDFETFSDMWEWFNELIYYDTKESK